MKLIKFYLGGAFLALFSVICSAQQKDTVPEGQFAWQYVSKDKFEKWKEWSFSETRWWGTFPKGLKASNNMLKEYPWAIGPITKYEDNPKLIYITNYDSHREHGIRVFFREEYIMDRSLLKMLFFITYIGASALSM
ncbi:MAG: hypothetical protein M1445_13105 [Bacteroidetes bacterium]|nr:hypothetical protein [Bacteroidota bacterium]